MHECDNVNVLSRLIIWYDQNQNADNVEDVYINVSNMSGKITRLVFLVRSKSKYAQIKNIIDSNNCRAKYIKFKIGNITYLPIFYFCICTNETLTLIMHATLVLE